MREVTAVGYDALDPELLAWVKQISHQFRGALISTILRDDGYAFSTIGGYVERADNTARILDMKYYVLLPRATARASRGVARPTG